jgi:hypothetical protein
MRSILRIRAARRGEQGDGRVGPALDSGGKEDPR